MSRNGKSKAKRSSQSNSSQKETAASDSQSSRSTEARSRGGGADSAPFSEMVTNVLATVNAGQAMRGTLDKFSNAVDELTMDDASEAISKVQDTIEHATETMTHAFETVEMAKGAFRSVKETAKDVFAQAKQKPEPFIAAAIPAVVGLYMLVRRSRAPGGLLSKGTRNGARTINA